MSSTAGEMMSYVSNESDAGGASSDASRRYQLATDTLISSKLMIFKQSRLCNMLPKIGFFVVRAS